jgi:hypothetical protein
MSPKNFPEKQFAEVERGSRHGIQAYVMTGAEVKLTIFLLEMCR